MKPGPLLLAIAVFTLTASSAHAQLRLAPSGRTGTFELGGVIQWFSGDSANGTVRGANGDLELDDLVGGGMNFGYNINEHLNINTDLTFSNADIDFFAPQGSLHDDADFFAWTVNLDYYILPTRFTPFLTAGLGFLYMDNWYDSWYCCYTPSFDTAIPISETDFLWNVGAGLRWDVADNIALKLSYRYYGTELEYANDYMFMHSVLLSVLFHFR